MTPRKPTVRTQVPRSPKPEGRAAGREKAAPEPPRAASGPRPLTPEEFAKLAAAPEEVRSALTALYTAFVWADHPDGDRYWRAVCKRLEAILKAAPGAEGGMQKLSKIKAIDNL